MPFKFDREELKKESLKRHEERSQLFKENRFMFEIEAKKEVEKLIKSAPPERQDSLRKLQKKWDNAMKGAGKHNRLIVAKTLLMDQFINKFKPALDPFLKEGE
jgi:hypothetical protein